MNADASETDHGEHKHHASVFLGGTTVFESDHSGFTIGIDYEYLLTEDFGVGIIAEHAIGEVDATSIFAALDWHMTEQIVLQLGTGVEIEDDEEFGVARLGAYYEFHIEETTLAPTISYNFSDHNDSLVFGVLIGRKF